MFGKFDALSLVGALVKAAQNALNHRTRTELEPGQSRQRLCIDRFEERRHALRSGTHVFEQTFDELEGGQSFGLRGEVCQHAMAQHGLRERPHVVYRRDVTPT